MTYLPPADLTQTGSLTAAQPSAGTPVAGGTVALALGTGQSAWDAYLAGTFSAGTTVQFEATLDGTNWFTVNVIQLGLLTATPINSVAGGAAAAFRGIASGLAQVRVRSSALFGGDSVTVTLRASTGSGPARLDGSLPAGTNLLGKVGIDQATPGTTNHVESATNSRRNGGTLHRNAITAVDKVAAAGTITISAVTEAGSALTAAARYATVIPYNSEGSAGQATPTIVTVTPTVNQAVRLAFAAVTGADGYDIFLSTSSTGPLWVGRITETQRASGGIISSVGVYSAGGTANSIDVGIDGTGGAANANPFITSNAYTPASVTPINCAGYSVIHWHVKLAVTDLRSLPTLRVIPFFQDQISTNDFFQGQAVTLNLLTAVGQTLKQDIVAQVDGATACVLLVDAISGQGAACSVWAEIA